jgi:predicted RNA-binding protein with PIN domain
MNFLIDGHNLIGSNLFSDIHLSDKDDEAKLVRRLKFWQSRRQKRPGGSMTVVFDRGIPGGIDVRMGGDGVEVVFAADPAQADDLIRRRLRRAKKNLILVSNDEALLREAAVYGITIWRGEDFVERMQPRIADRPEAGTEVDVQLSKAEVEEWLALFRAHRAKKLALKKRAMDGKPAQPGVEKRPPAAGPKKPPAQQLPPPAGQGKPPKQRRGGKKRQK